MAGDCFAAVCRLDMLLGSALSELKLVRWKDGICRVSRAGDLAAVCAVAKGLCGQQEWTQLVQRIFTFPAGSPSTL